jgi:hypothetical protein
MITEYKGSETALDTAEHKIPIYIIYDVASIIGIILPSITRAIRAISIHSAPFHNSQGPWPMILQDRYKS